MTRHSSTGRTHPGLRRPKEDDRLPPTRHAPPRATGSTGDRLRRLFWSDRRGRARTPWLIAVPVVGAYTTFIVVEMTTSGLPLPVRMLAMTASAAVVATALVLWSRRFLGAPHELSDYGLTVDRRWLLDLAAGLVLGLAAGAVPMLVGLAAGVVSVESVLQAGDMAFWPGIALIVVACCFTGYWEELTLRGVFIRNTADALRRWFSARGAVVGAVATSATVFGLAHFANPAIPAFILTWILSGVVLGVVYVRSGDLAVVIGAHTTFNIAHQVLFLRSEIPGSESLSAVTRVRVEPDIVALGSGGLLDAGGFVLLGLLGLLWLRHSRGRLPAVAVPAGARAGDQDR